ncbi:MAG: hypothetical protein Q4G28_01795 [Neisseria sp.]|nr:hypothetical protein [Neisseria sp.]
MLSQIIHFQQLIGFYAPFSDGLLPRRCRGLFGRLDGQAVRVQNKPVAFNHAAGFDSPNTVRQTSRHYPLLGGVVTSAFPCCTFPTGNRGTGGLAPARSNCVSVNPFLLFPAHTFDSVTAGCKNQFEKVHIMTQIRKGYSRPLISRKIRSFDTLAEAGRFIDRLTAANRHDYAFNIVQQDGRWAVCSVIAGGVQ